MRTFRLLSLIAGAAACTSGCHSDDSPDTSPLPGSALPPQTQAALAAWKAAPLKACDPKAALGLQEPAAADLHIDLSVAFAKSGSNAFVEAEGGPVRAVVQGYGTASGLQERSTTETASINGSATTVAASTHYTGGICTLRIADKVEAVVRLATSLEIGQGFDPAAKANGRIFLSMAAPRFQGSPTQANLRLTGPLTPYFRPRNADVDLVLSSLGISPTAQSRALVKVVQASGWDTARLTAPASSAWTSDEEFIGMNLSKVLFDEPQTLELEIRQKILPMRLPDDSVVGKPRMQAYKVVLQTPQTRGGEILVRKVEFLGEKSFSTQEAIACINERDELLSILQPASPERLAPAFGDLLNGCKALHHDLRNQMESSGTFAQLIERHVGMVPPGEHVSWNGWDGAVISSAIALHDAEKDIRKILDPNGATLLIPAVIDALDAADDALANAPGLTLLGDQVRETALATALRGGNNGTLGATCKTLEPLVNPLQPALERLLTAFANGENTTNAIAFASTIDAKYLAVARELRDSAVKAGMTDWVSQKLAATLEEKTQLASLQSWLGTTSLLPGFVERENKRNPRGAGSRHRASTMSMMITENFSDQDIWDFETLALLRRFDLMASEAFPKDASDMANDAGLDAFGKRPNQLLAPAFARRYVSFAAAVAPYLEALAQSQDPTAFSARSKAEDVAKSLVNFGRPLWLECSNSVFAERSAQLAALLGKLKTANSAVERWSIDSDIDEILRSRCD